MTLLAVLIIIIAFPPLSVGLLKFGFLYESNLQEKKNPGPGPGFFTKYCMA